MTSDAAAIPSRDRLEYFRTLRARLDPTGDPADAMAEHYVEIPGSVSARIAAELSLAPRSTHLLIGGIGSGKTTQLLAAQRRLVSQADDVRAFYIDASKQHDIAKMVPGNVAIQVGLELAAALEGIEGVSPFAEQLRELANRYWIPADPVRRMLEPLKGLIALHRTTTAHLVVLLDGLDRMTDLQAFEQIMIHDVKGLAAAGVGVVLVGPLRALYGLDRTISERFDSYHYQPWVDVARLPSGRAFFSNVLRKRLPEPACSDPAIDEIVTASGGVLRDLLTLAQSACVEAYVNGADRVEVAEVMTAVDAFGRKHLQGLRPAELEILQRVRTQGSFVHASEEDLALLMTRRVLEYREQGHLRYVVHPTLIALLQELARP